MCTKCLENKPASQFNRDKTKADGLQFRCKACVHEYMRKRRRSEASAKAEELEARRLEMATDNLAVLAQVRGAAVTKKNSEMTSADTLFENRPNSRLL